MTRKSAVKDNVYPDEVYRNTAVKLTNQHLSNLSEDHLYHLSLVKRGDNLEKQFGDVKVVCTGGSAERMKMCAMMMNEELGNPSGPLQDLSEDGHRFSMYKVGPVLFVNHGMGIPSLAILLHEVFKLLAYAKCTGVVMLRLGTCGGIGIEPGTLVITEKAVDDRMRPVYEQVKLGLLVQTESVIDHRMIESLKNFAATEFPQLPVFTGMTMSTTEFYEGQGRMDGAFCDFGEKDRENYLNQLKKDGVMNIEMEANAFAALCNKAGIKCGVVNVVLVNRLQGDQVKISKDEYKEYQKRPARFAIKYILKSLLN
ncbi:uridine phosphorylase 1 [Brevipalpus obovatus]|uniref:uridine phosphorylase 1 n=1 Tax=Brevipalpus obovatus TaxID=246614 RepID=UPI003D9F1D43